MSFVKLKDDFIEVATSESVGFASAKQSFLYDINDNDIDFPILLLEPVTKRININANSDYQYYNISFYAIAKNEINGGTANSDEMVEIWEGLSSKVGLFLNELQNTKEEYLITSEVKQEPNAHNFSVDSILLRVTFELRMEIIDC